MAVRRRGWFREHAADIAGKMPPEFALSARAIGKLRQVNLQDGESPLAHFQAVGSLPDLLANSQPIMRTPDESLPSSHDVAFYERRYAWSRFPDGARRHVLLTVRYLTKDSELPRMYSLEALEVRNALEALHEGAPGGQTAPSPSSPALGEILADFMDGVKPEHRQPKPAPGLAPLQEAGLAPAPGPLEESQTVVNPSPQPTHKYNQRGMQGQSVFAARANPGDPLEKAISFNTIDRAPIDSTMTGSRPIAGGEHQADRDEETDRWVKLTKPGIFGAQGDDVEAYMFRWAQSNRGLHDAVAFEGLVSLPDEDEPRAVIFQPDRHGGDASDDQQAQRLGQLGFHEHDGKKIYPMMRDVPRESRSLPRAAGRLPSSTSEPNLPCMKSRRKSRRKSTSKSPPRSVQRTVTGPNPVPLAKYPLQEEWIGQLPSEAGSRMRGLYVD